MKKLFTLILAGAAAATASAADFEILFKGQPTDPETVYETGYTIVMDVPGVMTMVKQNSDFEIRGPKGMKIVAETEGDAEYQFCGIDGACMMASPSSNYSIKKQGTFGFRKEVADGEIVTEDAELDILTTVYAGQEISDALHEATVTLKVYNPQMPFDQVSATVKMTREPAKTAIKGMSAAEGKIFNLGNALAYDFEGTKAIEIYSLSGTRVMSQSVMGQGMLDISSFTPGLYIYRSGALQGKIIIK